MKKSFPKNIFANRKLGTYINLIIVPLVIFLAGCSKKSPENFAELIIQGGTIYTVEEKRPIVEAVAVRDGLILYAGIATGVKKFIGPDTYILVKVS